MVVLCKHGRTKGYDCLICAGLGRLRLNWGEPR